MKVLELGRKPYDEVLKLQKELVDARAKDACEDTLILVEHEPVYTVGRGTLIDELQGKTIRPSEIKIKKLGSVPVVEIERGGKMTFHGPGQLVGYPIFKLTHHDLRKYLQDLERILITSISDEAGFKARPCPETLLLDPGQLQTGVWIHDRKIASIGIAVKQWVSYHGFALNFNTDLRYFQAISPCGFNGDVMTSLEKEMGGESHLFQEVMADVKTSLIESFRNLSQSYSQINLYSGDFVDSTTHLNEKIKEGRA